MSDENAEWDALGYQLKQAREYRGFSQQDIADSLGISRSSVSLMENGDRKVSSIELQKLADFYGISIDELVGRERESRQNEEEIDLLTRATQDLSSEDKEEVLRFAEFLKSRNEGAKKND